MAGDEEDDYNSSDLEFDTPEITHVYGQASINRLLDKPQELRNASKKAWKEQQYGYGAPLTVQHQRMWTRRFEVFRKDILKQSIDIPWNIETLVRFLDAIIG